MADDASSRLSRRGFIAGTSLAALGAGCSSEQADAQARHDESVVAVVSRADAEEAVNRALELVGGLREIKEGQTVFIKPNWVHGQIIGLPGIVATKQVLQAVIRAVKRQRPAKIIVGDRSARMFETEFVLAQSGMGDWATEAGADEIYAAPKPATDPDAWVLLQPPNFEETWGEQGGILAMKKLIEADHLIDLAQCKNHQWAAFSLSMKNLMGAVGDDSREPMHFNEGDPDRLSRDIALLNQLFQPTLCVTDATHALINGGPDGILKRVATEPGLVLAGKNRVAIDAMGAAILKLELQRTAVPDPDAMHEYLKSTEVWQLPQLRHGLELGLGGERITSAADVKLVFDGVADEAELVALYQQ